ncbi:hypothetical protein [Aquipseudomonas campi]
MNCFRVMPLVLVCGLLAACDDPAPAKPAPVPEVPATEQVAPQQAKPTPPPVKTETPSAPAETKAEKPAAAAKPAASKPKAVKDVVLPPAKLDLRLPAELVDQIDPSEVLEDPKQPLLPPLFTEKPAEPSPFELNGRLLTNEQQKDQVEGAEVQIKFRH